MRVKPKDSEKSLLAKKKRRVVAISHLSSKLTSSAGHKLASRKTHFNAFHADLALAIKMLKIILDRRRKITQIKNNDSFPRFEIRHQIVIFDIRSQSVYIQGVYTFGSVIPTLERKNSAEMQISIV